MRYENGRYLDGWYNRLHGAYVATMADVGVTGDLSPEDFLAAMDGYRQRDEQLRHVTPPSGGSGPFHLSVPAVRVELPCSVRDSCPGSEVPVARERAHWPCRRSAAPRRQAQSFCAATSTVSSARYIRYQRP
ncbi:hypothetical protein QFZ67_000244 [Streptomyces sp. V1I1]|nr:hypothetical protein [Streptomyces sp. V1I1]